MTIPEDFFATVILPFLVSVLVAFVVLIIARGLAGKARSVLRQSLAKTDLTESFVTLFTVLTFYSVMIVGVLVALAILGVPVATLVAGVGVVLVILGIAMQQSLSNFAATIIFLLFKPFEVGHIVETAGTIGVVREIQLFSTEFLTADQKVVILPNSKIQNDGITNYSKMGILRVDLLVGVGYEDDIEKAKGILEELFNEDERILSEPEPQIVVLELGDSAVNLAARPFVKTEDFWDVKSDLTSKVKERFDEVGISIPYPQRDVHVISG